MTEARRCENLTEQNREVRQCKRAASYVVIVNDKAVEYLCTQHANLIRERGNFGPDARLVHMQGC